MSKIILGMGFGDEGKGATVSRLCSLTENPIVVRFNGGHQCGHTVYRDDMRHVFSSFGSGTLQGVPTYYSKYCTFSPAAFYNEYKVLMEKVATMPKYFIHPLCPVTTEFDLMVNQNAERSNPNGSCGIGFGATIQRQEDYFKLYVQDLFYEHVLEAKLRNIAAYYKFTYRDLIEAVIADTINAAQVVRELITVSESGILAEYNMILEGGQGILLDQDFGFFPNVTRSNTTSKNASDFIGDSNPFEQEEDQIYYVTRTYQTRHGKGFMTNKEFTFPALKNAEEETNKTHEFQGEFRKSILDIDLLNYALQCDSHFSQGIKKNLVITCVDQKGDVITATENRKLITLHVNQLAGKLNQKFENVYFSYSKSADDAWLK